METAEAMRDVAKRLHDDKTRIGNILAKSTDRHAGVRKCMKLYKDALKNAYNGIDAVDYGYPECGTAKCYIRLMRADVRYGDVAYRKADIENMTAILCGNIADTIDMIHNCIKLMIAREGNNNKEE